VVPRSSDYDPMSSNQDWSSAYDYKSLARNSDFLSLMSYDDPRSLGPVASIPFTKRILDYMIEDQNIDPDKLSMGIPLYCWRWMDNLNEKMDSLTYDLAKKAYSKGKDKSKGFDEDLGAEWFKYKKDGLGYTVWCDNEQSMKEKLSLIEEYDLRGFSAWAIGQEDSRIWRLLK